MTGVAVFLRPARPVSLRAGDLEAFAPGVSCAELEPFELSGGIEAFDDERRR